ncbi:glycosyl transferase family protein [Algibacter lectus]|uniref:Glycosyl transferase family protein n=1 Tax=Algibacter lectus TaxID=221126 RepID=A0A090WXE4_9FLAO|nr:glycosyltransferase family 2 protein [Algibacter lectus]GAL81805.1 glycosyl transferase family protein [Algibacter lectus]
MNFEVSVIIPVFNAESYVAKAIDSALQQSEVREVIVINDGSTDQSVEIIEDLQKSDSRIKLFHHKNKINKGRSETRNLGISKATSEYIAFLDADDFYLGNRFKNDHFLFKEDQITEGVYNAIGAHFYKEVSSQERQRLNLTSVTEVIEAKQLFNILLSGRLGYFSIDGLTVKKTVFNKTGVFNNTLKVAEDTDLIWKMALKCKLVSGVIDEPVAMRGVHDGNVFNNEDLYEEYNLKLFESILFWSAKNNIDIKKIERIIEKIWILKSRQTHSVLKKMNYWFYLTTNMTSTLFTYLTVKYFPLIRYRKTLFSFMYKQDK